MFISIVGKHTRSLLDDLKAAGIEFEVRMPRPGVVMNSGELVDFARYVKDHAGWGLDIAAVLIAWFKARSGRKIMVTLPDHTIVQVEGHSIKSFAKVLEQAKDIVAMDMGKGAATPPPQASQGSTPQQAQ